MTIRFFRPPPALAGVVAWIYEHESAPAELGDLRWLIVPDGHVKLILPLSGDIVCTIGERRSDHPASRLILSGMRSLPGYLAFPRPVHALGVIIKPQAAYRLFDGHADVANRTLEASDVLGREVLRWQEDLGTLRRTEDRVAALEQMLSDRLAQSPRRDPAFEHAVRALSGREPVSVTALARSLGWSTRKLERRFRERLGLPPKRLASILRFHRSYARLRKNARWRAVTESPYYDQSHFLKEFQAYTGLTLGAYARASDYGRVYIPPPDSYSGVT